MQLMYILGESVIILVGIDLKMIDPFNISLNVGDRVGERSRTRSVADRQYPTPINSISSMASLSLSATLRERLRSGNASPMIVLVDHLFCGLF
jgi:hypothetical protein